MRPAGPELRGAGGAAAGRRRVPVSRCSRRAPIRSGRPGGSWPASRPGTPVADDAVLCVSELAGTA